MGVSFTSNLLRNKVQSLYVHVHVCVFYCAEHVEGGSALCSAVVLCKLYVCVRYGCTQA